MPIHVFLCHSSDDKALAKRVKVSLSRHFEVFFDESSLPPGESYNDRIRAAVRECQVFVFLASANSIAPGSYTLTELAWAERRWPHPAGRVLPVILDATSPERLPPYLGAVTLLQPKGNLEAEVQDAVLRIAGRLRRRRYLKVAVAVFAIFAIFAMIFAWSIKDGRQSSSELRSTDTTTAHELARDLAVRGPDRELFGGFTVTIYPKQEVLMVTCNGFTAFSDINVDVYLASDGQPERLFRIDQRVGSHYASTGLELSDKSQITIEFDGDAVYEPFVIQRSLATLVQDKDDSGSCRLYFAFGNGDVRLAPREQKDVAKIPALFHVLREDESRHYRVRAAKYLGKIGDHSATKAMLEALVGERDAYVKANIAYAIGELGDTSAISTLEQVFASYDRNESYGWMFEAALEKLNE